MLPEFADLVVNHADGFKQGFFSLIFSRCCSELTDAVVNHSCQTVDRVSHLQGFFVGLDFHDDLRSVGCDTRSNALFEREAKQIWILF